MGSNLSTDILPELYGCCDGPENWRPLLDRICAGLGLRSAAVQIYKREGPTLACKWQDRDSFSHAHASQHDRWINNPDNPRLAIGQARLGQPSAVLTDRDCFAANSPQLAETRHRLARVGLRGGTGFMAEFAPSRYFSLILHRQIEDPIGLDIKDKAFLEELAPHLQSLARVAARVETAQAAEKRANAIMDRLRVGIAWCRRDGTLSWHNRAAGEMLTHGAPPMLSNRQLLTTFPESRYNLARLLSGVTQDGMTTATFAHPDGRLLQAIGLPCSAFDGATTLGWAEEGEGKALIFVDPAQAPVLSVAHVQSLFGLTPAEAQLAIALSLGLSINTYAQRRGVSVGTVRIQMKRILEKTGSSRQANLVAKLYGSVMAQLQNDLH